MNPTPVLARRGLLLLGGLTFLLHTAVNLHGGYGIFRDELYYLASTRYLDIGYVDHPPLSIWILALNTLLFGQSVFALRLLPALLGCAAVIGVGKLAHDLGGGRTAQISAAIAAMTAPILLGMFGYYSMNAFDLIFWLTAFLLVNRIQKDAGPRTWIMLGVVVGLGTLNKLSMLWFGAGLLVALLFLPYRRWLRSPWPWIAGVIAFLIALPFLIWNLTHDLAHLEFMRNAAGQKYASQNPLTFLTGLVLIHNPAALPFWLAGFWFLIRSKDHRLYAIIVAAVLAILIINIHSKAEYFTGAMLVVFAAGGIQFERFTNGPARRWIRFGYPVLIALCGVFLLPVTLDVLPVETFIRYQTALGIDPPSTEGHRMNGLPQHYADRFGWKELAAEVLKIYAALSPEDKARCAIYGSNYGEAAAIDIFGSAYGLPKAYSQHNSYYYWGQKRYRGESVWIIIRQREEDLRKSFRTVELAGRLEAPWAMSYENEAPIYVCRDPSLPFDVLWREGKNFE